MFICWARSRISFKHTFFSYLFLEPHLAIYSSQMQCPIKISNWIMQVYLVVGREEFSGRLMMPCQQLFFNMHIIWGEDFLVVKMLIVHDSNTLIIRTHVCAKLYVARCGSKGWITQRHVFDTRSWKYGTYSRPNSQCYSGELVWPLSEHKYHHFENKRDIHRSSKHYGQKAMGMIWIC